MAQVAPELTLVRLARRRFAGFMREPLCSPCAPRITIVIADDYPVMREGLARLIGDECDLVVSGSAAGGRELRELVARQPPRVLVMELMLQDGDGLALIKDLVALAPALRIVVFSHQPEEIYAARCVRAGAHGYVMKHASVAALFRAIRDTAAGGIAVSPRIAASVLAGPAGRRGRQMVSRRSLPTANCRCFAWPERRCPPARSRRSSASASRPWRRTART